MNFPNKINQKFKQNGHVINLMKKLLCFCNRYEWYVSVKSDSFAIKYSFTLNHLIFSA